MLAVEARRGSPPKLAVGCPSNIRETAETSAGRPWDVRGMSVGCPWDVRRLFVQCLELDAGLRGFDGVLTTTAASDCGGRMVAFCPIQSASFKLVLFVRVYLCLFPRLYPSFSLRLSRVAE